MAKNGKPSRTIAIQHASPAERRRVLTILLVMTVFFAGLTAWLLHRLPGWADALSTQELVLLMRFGLAIALGLCALCFFALSVHAETTARRIRKLERWPLPGARTLFDRPIRFGAAALKLARRWRIFALLCLLPASALLLISLRLLQLSLKNF